MVIIFCIAKLEKTSVLLKISSSLQFLEEINSTTHASSAAALS
jgi:hypothetical protein